MWVMPLAVCLLAISVSVAALNPIVIKGHAFFDAVARTQFLIKGVAYRPRSQNVADPLANPAACTRDASMMAKLGLNAIRVYGIDPSQRHDECVKSFADAGIYILLDLTTDRFSVDPVKPIYNVSLYNAYTSMVDAFAHYNNMLAFVVTHPIANNQLKSDALAHVKAIIRDVKAYLRLTRKRSIPVGLATNDHPYLRHEIRDYFACGDEDSQTDFFGLNLLTWCGDSSMEEAGYLDRTREFANLTQPVFLSEFGCSLVTPRSFTEVAAIYGPNMTDVWSGGIVYQWMNDRNDATSQDGLVQEGNDTMKLQLLPDYTQLQNALARIHPTRLNMDRVQIDPYRHTPICPPLSDAWRVSPMLPPTPSQGACDCMFQNLACVATADGVQGQGGGSQGTVNASGLDSQIHTMCGLVSCANIGGNPQRGVYGNYSYCSALDKLSWLYHLYAQNHGICDFQGFATWVTPKRHDLTLCPKIPALVALNHTTASTSAAQSIPYKHGHDDGLCRYRVIHWTIALLWLLVT